MNWLSTKINKAVVAILGALVSWLSAHGVPIDFVLTPSDIQALGGLITAYLVWRIPNRVKDYLSHRPPL